MSDKLENNYEDLLIEFDDTEDEEEERDVKRKPINNSIDNDYAVKLSLAQEKIASLENSIHNITRSLVPSEDVEKYRQLEAEFADVDDRTKLYQNKVFELQNEKISNVLKQYNKTLEDLKEKLKSEELKRNELEKSLISINDSVALTSIARKHLEKDLGDVMFVTKGGKKRALGEEQVQQALKLYSDRYHNDAVFSNLVDSIYRDVSLTPTKRSNKIGSLIVDTFNQKIEDIVKKKKQAPKKDEKEVEKEKDSATDKAKTKDSPKDENKKEDSEDSEEKEKIAKEKALAAIKKSLAKNL